MTDFEYRTLNRIAQSDLSELARFLHPDRKKSGNAPSRQVLSFGTIFHAMVLEPLKPIDWSAFPVEKKSELYNTLRAMLDALYAGREGDAFLHNLERAMKEHVALWVDGDTGVEAKAKIDILRTAASGRFTLIHDLKTTACKTEEEFIKSCHTYGYDRQGAFYLSSDPRAEYFEITGIQKVAPFNVYRLSYHRKDAFIKGGQKQLRALLKSAATELAKPDGWRPSSWSRKEVEYA